jgi:hypothetical protein
MCPKLLGNGMRYTGFSWMRMCTLGCVCARSRFFLCEEGSLVGVFYLKFFFFFLRLILPLVLDVGAVGVVLLWWKNRCADKRPISMDCR